MTSAGGQASSRWSCQVWRQLRQGGAERSGRDELAAWRHDLALRAQTKRVWVLRVETLDERSGRTALRLWLGGSTRAAVTGGGGNTASCCPGLPEVDVRLRATAAAWLIEQQVR